MFFPLTQYVAIATLVITMENLLSTFAAAEAKGCNPATILRWIKQGLLPAVKMFGKNYVDRDVLKRFKPPVKVGGGGRPIGAVGKKKAAKVK